MGWFRIKRRAAQMYKDELNRRMFATASGRPKGAEKLKKLKTKGEKERDGWFRRLFRRST